MKDLIERILSRSRWYWRGWMERHHPMKILWIIITHLQNVSYIIPFKHSERGHLLIYMVELLLVFSYVILLSILSSKKWPIYDIGILFFSSLVELATNTNTNMIHYLYIYSEKCLKFVSSIKWSQSLKIDHGTTTLGPSLVKLKNSKRSQAVADIHLQKRHFPENDWPIGFFPWTFYFYFFFHLKVSLLQIAQ